MNNPLTNLLRRLFTPGVGACVLLATVQVASAAFPTGKIVSPYVIGQNYWYQPPDSAYAVVGTSGVKLIRIGGHEPDVNPYTDALILKQVDNIRSIGAEPLIQISRSVSAATAANTVAYINVTNNRAVKFWSIGNEPDLNWPGTEASLVTTVANYVKTLAPAMRDVDPTITIYAPDMAWFAQSKYAALVGGSSDITGKDSKGRYYVDGINFHTYPFGNVITRDAVLSELHSGFEAKVSALVNLITAANTLNGRTGSAALTWGLTEFNMTYSNPSGVNNASGLGVSSFLNGQFFAEYYRVTMKYGGHDTATWSMLEGGGAGAGGDLGFLGGSWSAPVKRSSFYHMQMVANYLLPGGYLAATSSSANLAVLSTSTSGQSRLAVMLMNEDTSGSQSFTIRMNDEAVSGAGTKINVSAGLAKEYSGSIDNQSTVVLIFDAAGVPLQRITYSLALNLSNSAPVVETIVTSPVITAQPQGHTIAAGSTVAFDVTASGGSLTYRWLKNGAPLAGATSHLLVVSNAQAADAGSYSVVVTNSSGSATSEVASLAVQTTNDPGHLSNASVRTTTLTGDQVLIVGFVTGGTGTTGSAGLLIRGLGPRLTPFGVPDVLADPVVEIIPQGITTAIATNDNWAGDTAVSSAGLRLGATAFTDSTSKDAALLATLAKGAYSVKVSGKNSTTGTTLAEVYDADPTSTDAQLPRLVNISARSQMDNSNPLIAGFVVTGQTAKTVMIRGLGPFLAQYLGNGVMADPKLEIYTPSSGGDRLIASNNDWAGDAQLTQLGQVVGAQSLTNVASKDAVVLVTLDPGVYSAVVTSADGASGIALVEVYTIQ